MAVRASLPAAISPQVVQFPQAAPAAFQQTIPVQIPVSQNGQTVYQTVQMQVPVQSMQTAVIPQIVQTSAGQQIVMQQVVQPAAAAPFQPQLAQVLMPNGQLQQVQVIGGMPATQIPAGLLQQQQQTIPVQLQQQQPVTTTTVATTSTTFSTGTTTTSSIVSSSSSSSTAASATQAPTELLQPKLEPEDPKPESDSSDDDLQQDQKAGMQSLTASATTNIQQQTATNALPTAIVQTPLAGQVQVANAQQVLTNVNGQQVILQQPGVPNAQAQLLSVRTPSGQIVQVEMS